MPRTAFTKSECSDSAHHEGSEAKLRVRQASSFPCWRERCFWHKSTSDVKEPVVPLRPANKALLQRQATTRYLV